ncbi:MAG: hypothetical protein ABSH19_07675 [Opitutales bacterium]|jgi:hypothetical protein
MKVLLHIAGIWVMALGLAGCSTTNDQGVNINHSTDIFGAAPAPHASTTPAAVNAPDPSANS